MKKFIITFVFVGAFSCFAAPVENAVFNNKSVRDAKVKELREKAELEKAEAVEWAKAHNMKVRQKINGRIVELMRIDRNGQPVYYTTFNHEAAISTAANLVRETFPYDVDGESLTVGIWDGGVARATHPEFGSPSRITVKDGGSEGDHPTHVAGTIGAAGVSANAKGMAPKINIDAYDWDNDTSEMASRGASSPDSSSGIHLSNHSYGRYLGWADVGVGRWVWMHELSVIEDPNFGLYDSDAVDMDSIAYNAPYYLICRAAGNDRIDGPNHGASIYWYNSSDETLNPATYNSAIHPKGDGEYKNGYDTIGPSGCAKNILTIGAVNEAVSGDDRNLANGTMSSFSGWGPTDDGRIKPDVVGNGVAVFSPTVSSYGTWNGTSMASPNVCGSAALLVELYKNLHSGNAMRASSLKALLIHTADDMGKLGPDFAYGWGLINTKAAADIILANSETNITAQILEDLFGGLSQNEYLVTLTNSQNLKVTLCWTDPVGTESDSHDDRTAKLVNDLDLRIIDFDGNTNFPFVLDVENPSDNATKGDNSVDNVEQIIIENAATGSYKIVVSSKGSVRSQYYSLITPNVNYVLPNTPYNVLPTNGTLDLSTTPTLQSSAFSDPDLSDVLSASEWQVCFDDNFSNIVWEGNSGSTSVTVPSGNLNYVTQYFWRVKHSDNHNIWSGWSTATYFKTLNIKYIDGVKITKAINKKKTLLLKGTGLIFSQNLNKESVLINFNKTNLLSFTGNWQNKKTAAILKAADSVNNMKGIAKIKTDGKKAGTFIIKGKRSSEKIDPITGEHSVTVTVGNEFFTNTLNFIKGKYKE